MRISAIIILSLLLFGCGKETAKQVEKKPEQVKPAEPKGVYNFSRKYVNNKGKTIFENSMGARPFHDGVAVNSNDGKAVIHDEKGKVIATITQDVNFNDQITGLQTFSEGLCCLSLKVNDPKQRYVYIDKTGKEVFKLKHSVTGPEYYQFTEGLLRVQDENGKYGYLDKTGKFKIEPKYGFSHSFGEGLAAVSVDRIFGFIDKDDKMVIKPQFDEAGKFSEGLCAVKLDTVWQYINKKGETVFKLHNEVFQAEPFHNGFAIFYQRNNKKGLVDKAGKVIAKAEYMYIGNFEDGLCPVGINKDGNNKYGYLNEKGEVAIPLNFRSVRDFKHGAAVVLSDEDYQLIDKTGKVIATDSF